MYAWWNFTYLFLGMSICLSNFMIGQELVKEYGLIFSIIAIAVGNSLLLVLALVKARMGFDFKATTIEVAQRYFGTYGSILLSLILSFAIVGWFGIELNLTASAAHKASTLLFQQTVPQEFFTVFLSLLITIVVVRYGIKGIEKLTLYFLPLFLLCLGVVVVNALHIPVPVVITHKVSLQAISIVFATAIAAVIDMPVLFRQARSYKDACISSMLFLLIILPGMQLIGAFTAFKMPQQSFVDMLTGQTTFPLQLAMLLFLIIAGWVSNSSNIYSGAFSIELLIRLRYGVRVAIVGILGMLCAWLITFIKFESIINSMGIVISTMGAIVAVNYLFERHFKQSFIAYKMNIALLIVSSTIGFCSFAQIIVLTGSEVIDAFVTATVLTVLSKFYRMQTFKIMKRIP